MIEPQESVSKARRWIIVVAVAFGVLFLWGFYQYAYDRGTRDSALDFARRSECRATLAVPIGKARDQQIGSLGIGLVAAVAADNPEVQRRLEAIAHRTADAEYKAELIKIIDLSETIKRKSEKQGDPVERCKDGKP